MNDSARVVSSPYPTGTVEPGVGFINVILQPFEEVEWHFAHGSNGSYVHGYTIRRKWLPPKNHRDEIDK